MSTPAVTMHSVVTKRIQSVLSLWAISGSLQLIHNLFENFAALLVALELIEAGAGGREQDSVARAAVFECVADGGVKGLGRNQRHRAFQRVRDLGGGGADQKRGVRFRG